MLNIKSFNYFTSSALNFAKNLFWGLFFNDCFPHWFSKFNGLNSKMHFMAFPAVAFALFFAANKHCVYFTTKQDLI